MSSGPSQRDPAKDYGAGVSVYRRYLPLLLADEQHARETQDPQRIQHSLDLEQQFDPQRADIRNAMESNVRQGVQSGYSLPPGLERQMQQEIRGAQAARGNVYGNAPISAEAAYTARGAVDLYNRNLANAGTVLGMPSVAQPDRTAAYTGAGGIAGPSGVAWGQQQFLNQQNSPNPWSSALSGGVQGYASTGSLWGAALGAAGGYVAASDGRLKEDIHDTGEKTRDGIPIVNFRYKGLSQRFRGVIAQAVEKIMPEAVVQRDGWKFVNYGLLGLEMQEVN